MGEVLVVLKQEMRTVDRRVEFSQFDEKPAQIRGWRLIDVFVNSPER